MSALLDICNASDSNNLWFVVALLGAVGLNLLLTGVLFVCFCVRGASNARGGRAAGGSDDFGVPGVSFEPTPKGSSFEPVGGGGWGTAGEGDLAQELREFKRQLMMMDRKIDNKRVNEITASYMLHNAHDAIGNHVPTAAQVTLDQIGSHQFFIKQRVEDMDKRMQHIEVHLHEDIVKVCVHVCVCARARVCWCACLCRSPALSHLTRSLRTDIHQQNDDHPELMMWRRQQPPKIFRAVMVDLIRSRVGRSDWVGGDWIAWETHSDITTPSL